MNRRKFIHRLSVGALALTLTQNIPFLNALAKINQNSLPETMKLDVKFTIKPPSGSGRYHKPYVAVWIEDSNGKMVRTISLWSMQAKKGVKWLPDLRKWYRSNGKKEDTKSSATRPPGSYSVSWDGLNDKKVRMPTGEYTVFVEVAREDGPYGRARLPITLGNTPTKTTKEGKGDLGSVVIEYKTK